MRTRSWILLLTAAALAAGCTNSPLAAPPKATPKQAIVSVVKPERKSLRRTVEQPGTVRAYEETPIFARLAGFVQKVHVDIGDQVRGPKYDAKGNEVEPGQLLAEVAIPEMIEEARQKEALVRQAEVEVEQAKKTLLTAEANILTATALVREAEAGLEKAQGNHDRWKSESERFARLFAQRVVDEQARDETLNQFRSAAAARKEAKARIASAQAGETKSRAGRDKAEVDVRVADARLQVVRAESARLQALLRYTKLRAPYDGVITRRRIDTGHFLQPAGNNRPEDAVFVVVRLDKVRVFVEVPETDAPLVKDGAEAKVAIQALKRGEFSGKVSRTSWALEPGARTLRTEIDLPNEERRLRPGMYAYARIFARLPEGWVLPTAALAKQGDTVVCFQLANGKAVRTPVQTGRSDGDSIEVLKKQRPGSSVWTDWTGEEEVAASQVANLTDGQPVRAAR